MKNEIPIGLESVAQELDALSVFMRITAEDMKFFGGFDGQMNAKANELAGAAKMAREWAAQIRKKKRNW